MKDQVSDVSGVKERHNDTTTKNLYLYNEND